ncbi:unnamed protein product [Camellia sinensis]
MGVDSHTAVSSSSLENGTTTKDYKMASSSSNNSNIRLKPRLCDCGRTAAMHIVRTNQNGIKGTLCVHRNILVKNTAITSSSQMIMMTT